mgnify:CR=1 FL=1
MQDLQTQVNELKSELRKLTVRLNIISEKFEVNNLEFIMRKDVVTKYRVSINTLDKYIREGIIPSRRQGGRIFLLKSDCDMAFKPLAR